MSQKYQCADCGYVFDEPVIIHDNPSPGGVLLPPGDYTYAHCPECGGDHLHKVQPCTTHGCDGYAFYLEKLCEDCQRHIWVKCEHLLIELSNEGFIHKDYVQDVMQDWLERG